MRCFIFRDGIATFHGRQLDTTADKLIRAGKIPATIFVEIDNGGSTLESKHPGSDRADEYLPCPDDSLIPAVPVPHGRKFPDFLERKVRPLVEIEVPDARGNRTGWNFLWRGHRSIYDSGAPWTVAAHIAGSQLS